MSEPDHRTTAQSFFDAFVARDPSRVARLLADDVEWTIIGPVALFPFCGTRIGKAAALDYLTRAWPEHFSMAAFQPEEVVIDGDRAAMFSRATIVQKKTGRTITYNCAHFITLRGDKVARLQGLTDTFDVVEQTLGHRINPYYDPNTGLVDDVVAL
jgi:ketosteroid isomerase-like protein